jgi:LuxR family maltose regulon positive regulatory protein
LLGTQVVELLTALEDDVVLVVDDLHELSDPLALDHLTHLLAALPPAMAVVLVARSEPEVRLHGLRLAGDLVEVGEDALAFTDDEATELFAQHGLQLSPDQHSHLLTRTRGWAAGLRLAAVSAASVARSDQGAVVARFDGSDRGISSYLSDELLDRQPSHLRRFILETSIVDGVVVELADALTGAADSASALDALHRAGIIRPDLHASPGTFRYPELFAESFRHRLAIEDPAHLQLLHKRAMDWHVGSGNIPEGVRHGVAARDWDGLGDLLLRVAGAHLLGDDGAELRRLVGSLPAEAADSGSLAACLAVLASYDGSPAYEVDRRTTHAERLLDGVAEPLGTVAALLLHLVRARLGLVQGDVGAAAAHSTCAFDLAATLSKAEVPAVSSYAALVGLVHSRALAWLGDAAQAAVSLQRWLAAGSEGLAVGLSRSAEASARSTLALALAVQGRLTGALTQAREAADLARSDGWDSDGALVGALLAEALVHLHRDDRREMEEVLCSASDELDRRPDTLHDATRRLLTARLLVSEGVAPAAGQVLDEVQDKIARLPDPGVLRGWFDVADAETALAAQDPVALLKSHPSHEPLSGEMRVLVARALLRSGHIHAGVAAARKIVNDPDCGVLLHADAWLVVAEGAWLNGQDISAQAALGHALALAGKEYVRRCFAVAGPAVHELLLRRPALGSGLADVPSPRLAPDEARVDFGSLAPGAHFHPAAPLTGREQAVLDMLPSMRSNQEIAGELFVSVNTVKAHLKSIYRKLAVSNRREAVAAGRVRRVA